MKDSAQLIQNRLDTIKEIEAKDELQHLAFKVSRRECQIFSLLCEGFSLYFILFIFPNNSFAQANALRMQEGYEIGGTGNESLNKTIATEDGNFLIVGQTGSSNLDFESNPNNTSAFISKITNEGVSEWVNFNDDSRITYDDAIELDNGNSIIVSGKDNSSLIAKRISSTGQEIGNEDAISDLITSTGSSKSFLVKESETTFSLIGLPNAFLNGGGSGIRLAFQKYALTSNGIVKVGSTQFIDAFNNRFTFINNIFYDQTEILLVGITNERNSCVSHFSDKIGVIRLGLNGQLLDERIFGSGNGIQAGSDITKASNGEILITGSNNDGNIPNSCDLYSDPNGNLLEEMVLLRLDQNLNVIWSTVEGGNGIDIGRSVLELADGTIIVGGYSTSSNENYTNTSIADYVIWIYDSDGTYVDQINITGSKIDGLQFRTHTLINDRIQLLKQNNSIWAIGPSSSNDGNYGRNNRITGASDDIWLFPLGDTPQGKCIWRGWVYNPLNAYQEPDEVSCDFIQGGTARISSSLAEQNTYWTGYTYSDDFFEIADGITVSMDARNGVSTGGISCFDLELWVFGENSHARMILTDGFSSCSQFTQFGEANNLGTGLSSLNRNLNNWNNFSLEISNNVVSLRENNSLIVSRSYTGQLGRLTGVKVAFKGSGEFDNFQIRDSDDRVIFSDNFSDCSSNCPGCVFDESLTEGFNSGGNFEAINKIEIASSIVAHSNLSLIAGECINMQPGFEVMSTAVYEAQIDGCSSECFDPNFIPQNGPLITLFDPVCGCDNRTYNSPFEAEQAGLLSWSNGPCQD